MKKIITFYVLLTLKDLEFLAKNNFTKLPFNEIPFTFNKESIEKFAETSIEYTENILVTAKIDCDWIRFSEYKYSNPDEDLTEFGRLSEVKTNTFNHSLIDKIKIQNVFGINLQNADCAKIKMIVEEELYFFKHRMEMFLETNSREIILADIFNTVIVKEQEPQKFTDEEIRKQIEDMVREDEVISIKMKEKRMNLNSVEEAVDFLINEDLSEESTKSLKNISPASRLGYFGGDSALHFGYGMYLRNLFLHGNKNELFLNNLEEFIRNSFSDSGELGEGIIYDLLWRKLNNWETSGENKIKIEKIQREVKEDGEYDSNWYNKVKLLSYNCTEDEIKKYLELERKMENENDNFEEYYYQQKALLARLDKEEREIFENLKQDYFNVQNILNILEHKHE